MLMQALILALHSLVRSLYCNLYIYFAVYIFWTIYIPSFILISRAHPVADCTLYLAFKSILRILHRHTLLDELLIRPP
jgi:hypothetical protein